MTDQIALAPPALLEPPKPVAPVQQEQAAEMVQLDESMTTDLDTRSASFIDGVVSERVISDSFQAKLAAIHNLGSEEIRASASVSNRMLDRPTRAMKSGLFDESSEISQDLVALRKQVEDLDPSRHGDLMAAGNLEKIPLVGSFFVSPMRKYFMEYQSAQANIDAIINSLYHGQDELRKDNAAIEQEKVNLWDTMQKVSQYIYLAKHIDANLESRIADIEGQEPEKARVVKEEMLFYVRQKVQDLLTQQAVSIQGYLALDMVRKNNLELIKGVDRATTTTVSALRTAVMVAQALANQKLVLDQISALNTTTSNMIESTSVLLKQNTADIHKQASEATIEIEQLQRAFDNIYETMDMISDYKVEALDNMQETVNVLTSEVQKANTYLDRVRGEEAARSVDVEVREPFGRAGSDELIL
jgi:uncharacterized protein YaaN involved in tellurite resistance